MWHWDDFQNNYISLDSRLFFGRVDRGWGSLFYMQHTIKCHDQLAKHIINFKWFALCISDFVGISQIWQARLGASTLHATKRKVYLWVFTRARGNSSTIICCTNNEWPCCSIWWQSSTLQVHQRWTKLFVIELYTEVKHNIWLK